MRYEAIGKIWNEHYSGFLDDVQSNEMCQLVYRVVTTLASLDDAPGDLQTRIRRQLAKVQISETEFTNYQVRSRARFRTQ